MQHGHITSVRTYLIVFAALMVFTVLTIAVAFLNLGPFNDVVALAIAITKATLIILFFMHVRHSDGLTKVVVIAGWLWLALLIIGVFSDILTRGWR
jgi:cytochrome c oxidase subunit IV